MTLCNLLEKMPKSKRDWHEKLGDILWAYWTLYRTPKQSTPYALAYGVEAALPSKIQILSLHITMQEGFNGGEKYQLRLAELEALAERRFQAQQKLECY